MADNALVEDLRKRAGSLVSETMPFFNQLLQELPGVMILAHRYRAAADSYATIRLRQRDILALRRVEEMAEKRYRLMRERYSVSQHSILAIQQMRYANGTIAVFQGAIAAGKLAEMWISVGKWAKLAKEVVDDAKDTVDVVKAGVNAFDAGTKGDATGGAVAAAQFAAIKLRINPDLERLSKLIWDSAGTVRRYRSANEWSQQLSTILNVLKAIVDQLALYDPKIPGIKMDSRNLGIARDLVDAGRALYRAGEAFMAYRRATLALDLAAEESAGYVGKDDHVDLEMVPFAEVDPVDIVAEARSMGGARSLIAETQRAAERLQSDMSALDSLHWLHVTRLHVALERLRPKFDALKPLMDRLDSQIANLKFLIDKGKGPNAAALQPICDALVGMRVNVNALVSQINGALLPKLPVLDPPEPLRNFGLEEQHAG